jgi:hypothetical protein
MNQIRLLVNCLLHDKDRILVAEGDDPTGHETFYRPLGAGKSMLYPVRLVEMLER